LGQHTVRIAVKDNATNRQIVTNPGLDLARENHRRCDRIKSVKREQIIENLLIRFRYYVYKSLLTI